MIKPLNYKQRILAAKNHNLIYKYAHENNISIEDYYDVLAIGLCKAAAEYDRSKGRFSTFAYVCMRNEMILTWRKCNKKSSIPENLLYYYEAPSVDDYGNSFEEELVDESSINAVDEGIGVLEFMDTLNDKEKDIVKFLLCGMTHKEISGKMDCTRQNVSFSVKRIGEKLNKFMSYN